jgi:hypothetical protein
MGYRFFSALLLLGISLGLQAGASFANAQEEAKFPDLMAAIDRTDVVFVVHNGDFKSGSSPYADALFSQRYKLFQSFKHSLIYIFGDNEWTDCHRSGSDALDRLAKLREIFTQEDTSLGQSPLPLTRQSANPLFSKFRENRGVSCGSRRGNSEVRQAGSAGSWRQPLLLRRQTVAAS